MKRRKLLTVLMALTLLLPLPGCQEQLVLNRRLLISGIGVDREENGKFLVSVQAANVEAAPQDPSVFLTAEGESVPEALNALAEKNGRTPLYSHNLAVIFGKRCARTGLQNALDFFIRGNESRPDVLTFLAENTAREILEAKKSGKLIPAQELEALSERGEANGSTVRIRMADLFNSLYDADAACLPVLRAEEEGISTAGTALLRGENYQDRMDAGETLGYLMISGRARGGSEVLEVPGAGRVTLELSRVKSTIVSAADSENPRFRIELTAEASVSAVDGAAGEKLGAEYYEIFEKALREKIAEQANAALEKAAVRNRCDIFHFGRILMQQHTQYWKDHEKLWREEIGSADFTVVVQAHVIRVGQEITPLLSY